MFFKLFFDIFMSSVTSEFFIKAKTVGQHRKTPILKKPLVADLKANDTKVKYKFGCKKQLANVVG